MGKLIGIAMIVMGLSSLVGCGRGETETCSICRGSGRSPSGSACRFCNGRGYKEISSYESNRRAQAEDNLRCRESGEAPLSNSEWWWGTTGKATIELVIMGAAYWLIEGRKREKTN